VHFEIEHTIAASRAVVETALGDPGFYEVFGGMADVSPPTLLDRTEHDGAIEVHIRCAFTGELSGSVTAVVDPSQLSWVSAITLRPAEHTADLVLVPDNYADRLDCSASYAFEEGDDGSTREVIEGELVVHFPIFGGKIEQAILGGVEKYVADEAEAMGRWAAGRT